VDDRRIISIALSTLSVILAMCCLVIALWGIFTVQPEVAIPALGFLIAALGFGVAAEIVRAWK